MTYSPSPSSGALLNDVEAVIRGNIGSVRLDDHGNFAQPPAIAAVTSDDEPPAAPTKRRSSRTREPKQ